MLVPIGFVDGAGFEPARLSIRGYSPAVSTTHTTHPQSQLFSTFFYPRYCFCRFDDLVILGSVWFVNYFFQFFRDLLDNTMVYYSPFFAQKNEYRSDHLIPFWPIGQ